MRELLRRVEPTTGFQCVPSAKEDKELKEEELNKDQPVLYVGESSRSIAERSREHWALYKRGERTVT